MNKEYLEAFGRITLHTEYDNDGSYDCLNFEDDCKLVDEALQRLEAIDSAEPSEALWRLERLYEYGTKSVVDIQAFELYTQYRDIIKQALLKLQELETMAEEYDLQPSQIREALLVFGMMKGAGYKVSDIEKAQEQEKENAKYKQLEEQLGCPLDVLEKLFKQDFIYFKYPTNVQIMKVKVYKGLSYGSNPGWYFTCIYNNLDFICASLRDYKKTWWLKENREE